MTFRGTRFWSESLRNTEKLLFYTTHIMRRPKQQVGIGLLLRLQTVDYGYYTRTIRYNPRSQW